MTGLLDDPTAGRQESRLALHLRAHRSLDRAQRVHVLRFAPCPHRRARLIERQIDVATKGPFLHAHIRDAECAHEVAQFGNIGLGDIRHEVTRPSHRLRDDLDERDARAVVIDERVVRSMDAPRRAARMGELAGVLLHVHPFDFNADDLRSLNCRNGDIEVAVRAEWLVVLADLIILGHVRVEVVLPGEATPLGDRAVEGETDADR